MVLLYLQPQEGFYVKHKSEPLEAATSRALDGFGTAPAFEMMENSLVKAAGVKGEGKTWSHKGIPVP